MKVGTEQEWQAARKGLLAAEREFEEPAQRVEQQRRELPWVPVEKQYGFASLRLRVSPGGDVEHVREEFDTWASSSARRRNGCATTARRSWPRTLSRPLR
jgi:hypothetical protein